MLEVTVEGIYESDIGSGQKKYKDFKYTFSTSRLTEKGLGTHVKKRFVPLLIAKDKTKSGTIYSRMKSFLITDIKQIDDTKDCIFDKDIMTLNSEQIQDLACAFDLFKIPLPNSCSITEMRELAVMAYMEKVLKIPMKTTKEKEQLIFLEKQSDGTFKLNLGDEKVYATIPEGYFNTTKTKEPVTKKSLAYFVQQAGKTIADGILSATGNQTIDKNQNIVQQANGNLQQSLGAAGLALNPDNQFPTGDELLNK